MGELVHKLREYDYHTIQAVLGHVETKIRRFLLPKRLGVVIAQVAAAGILAGKLISPSTLSKNKNILFNNKNQIHYTSRLTANFEHVNTQSCQTMHGINFQLKCSTLDKKETLLA
ncbi:hypothetical protein BGZ82_001438 [Podila clonocystis]|nr:hypothetical protein BGZ82_001438 [Podila clonocystis]